MEELNHSEVLTRLMPRNNGNPNAMIYVQGRMAAQKGISIFDCPFEVGSDKSEIWMDGYMFEEKKNA